MDFTALLTGFAELGPSLGVVVAIMVVVIAFLWSIVEMMKRFFNWMDKRDERTMGAWDSLKKSVDANTEVGKANMELTREHMAVSRSMHALLDRQHRQT